MHIKDFINMSITEGSRYNFEFACENDSYMEMNFLDRYFTYKSLNKDCRAKMCQ